MTIYGRNQQPHPSHVMTEWESTIVTIISTARFGGLRRCVHCEAEQARTVAGEAMHEELARPCTSIPQEGRVMSAEESAHHIERLLTTPPINPKD